MKSLTFFAVIFVAGLALATPEPQAHEKRQGAWILCPPEGFD
jgi:hypothetical protein